MPPGGTGIVVPAGWLRVKLHADQLDGGGCMAARHAAPSADHLEYTVPQVSRHWHAATSRSCCRALTCSAKAGYRRWLICAATGADGHCHRLQPGTVAVVAPDDEHGLPSLPADNPRSARWRAAPPGHWPESDRGTIERARRPGGMGYQRPAELSYRMGHNSSPARRGRTADRNQLKSNRESHDE